MVSNIFSVAYLPYTLQQVTSVEQRLTYLNEKVNKIERNFERILGAIQGMQTIMERSPAISQTTPRSVEEREKEALHGAKVGYFYVSL